MALVPRLISVSCFGTLVQRTRPRGQQIKHALEKAFPPSTDVPSAAALYQGYKSAFRKQSAVAPNFGKGTVGSSRIWWRDVMRETVTGAGAFALVSDRGFEIACDHLYDNLHENWELCPTTEDALSNLRSYCDLHDCRLGVVANMDDRLPHLLARLGIADKFDFILSSYDCGAEQPDPYIYFNALALSSVPPSSFQAATPPALHCGHLAMDDLHGALGAGFAAMLVNTKFSTLSPLQQLITEWQTAANKATRAWHSPHLGLAMGLLANPMAPLQHLCNETAFVQ
mmetsp:Transcript_114092/g.227014  ORF Transcript_114092/g.227014 Transcript_114092/m.227014 type:complete len:284 (+) Transcript_114092:67-918(+)